MDPIANSFTQIKNALNASQKEVYLSYSKLKLAILATLKHRGLIEDFKEEKSDEQKYPKIKVVLKYKVNREAAFTNIRRVSRPGRRVYLATDKIAAAKRGKIDIILSTSQGVMSGTEAKAKGLGGEVIGEVV